ncbi:SGNH/GDSL hydrolase family protein [Nonomuraea rubra]
MTRDPGVIRMAALGDSVTVGIGDPVRGRGWAGLLAESLAASGPVEPANLAVSGARLADVLRDQLPRALELRPAVATVLIGVNDTLRGDFDPGAFATGYESLLSALHGSGATVLTATLPDPGLMLRLPELLRRPLARRARAVNAAMEGPAARYGTVHVDLAAHPALYDPRMWGLDRLHPSERGHRHLAGLFAAALESRGLAVDPPDPEPAAPDPSPWASAFWLATAGTAWLARRCVDFLPGFARLVAEEYRQTRVDREFACRVPAGEPRVAPAREEPEHEGRHRGRVVPAAGERGHQLGLPHP